MQMPYEPQPYVYQSPVGTEPTAPIPPEPSNWFAKNKRLVLMAIGAVVLLAIVAVVVLFVVNRNKARRAIEENAMQEQTAAVETAASQCEDEKNPEKCAAAVRPELAQNSGKVSYCEGLSGDQYDNCVGLAALTAKSATACEQIVNVEKRTACVNAVAALLTPQADLFSDEVDAAIAARNPALCAAIADERDRNICYEIVGDADLDLDGFDVGEEAALGTSDTDTDSDDDGLSDFDEVNQWGTDPANPDSDGDSFSDGTEVEGGYNPLGAGRL